MAMVGGNCYEGDFGTVVEVGVRYALGDPSLSSPMIASAGNATGSPFNAWASGLSNGDWYYAAYVKTADGSYFYGDVKVAAYP